MRGGAAWSAHLAHNQENVGSNPTPATMKLRKAQKRLQRRVKGYEDSLTALSVMEKERFMRANKRPGSLKK